MKFNKASLVSGALLVIDVLLLAGIMKFDLSNFDLPPVLEVSLLVLVWLILPLWALSSATTALKEIKNSQEEGRWVARLVKTIVVGCILTVIGLFVLSVFSGGCGFASRCKGPDAKTKAQLSGLRLEAAEAYFSAHGNYGPVTNSCSTPNSMFTDKASKMAEYTDLKNYQKKTILSCDSRGSSYSVSATLSGPQKSWCVDSKGNTMQGKIDTTTHLCAPL